MKKFLKLSFDSAEYYDYKDDQKTVVGKSISTKESINPKYLSMYFEGNDETGIYKELGTGKRMKLNYTEGQKRVNGNMTFMNLRNAMLSECSGLDVVCFFRLLQDSGREREYVAFIKKLIVDAPICYKLQRDNQVRIDRESIREVESKKTVSTNAFAKARMAELIRELTTDKEKGL